MSPRLLIATIGGSPEPITASLLHWRPARVIFVVSAETKASVSSQVLPSVQNAGWTDFDAGRYDLLDVADAQDYTGIVIRLRALDGRIRYWMRDRPGAELIADFTGGTKAMTAGLALAAAGWPCQISYVGGSVRTKEGVGIVVSGREQIVHARNPWDALGYLAAEQALLLFDNGNFSAAVQLLESTRDRMTDASRKREFQALAALCLLCELWERFQHKDALSKLSALQRDKNDLSALLGSYRSEVVLRWLVLAEETLKQLAALQAAPASRLALVRDLLGNAQRRIGEGRFDDAVARLYRAIEALAQARLHEHGFTDTAKVPLEKVPEPLRTEWQSRASDGVVKLGLQDDYVLLATLGDEMAVRFNELELDHPQRSQLVSRNSSILAHGYAPVGKEVAERLFAAALKLANIDASELLFFPRF
jgi:CRISPR-associated protein (TIGR02710 family)